MDSQALNDKTMAATVLLWAAEQALLIVDKKEGPCSGLFDGHLVDVDQYGNESFSEASDVCSPMDGKSSSCIETHGQDA